MKCLFVYSALKKDGIECSGNADGRIRSLTAENIKEIEQIIKKRNDFENVVITNIIKLDE